MKFFHGRNIFGPKKIPHHGLVRDFDFRLNEGSSDYQTTGGCLFDFLLPFLGVYAFGSSCIDNIIRDMNRMSSMKFMRFNVGVKLPG